MDDTQKRKRVNSDTINVLRRAVIDFLYESEESNERYIKREAIKQLMGVIIAAKKSGRSFEELAELFTKNGFDISANTLRTYFFELRADAEIQAETKMLADKIEDTKKSLDLQRQLVNGTAAHKQAKDRVKKSMAGAYKVIPYSEAVSSPSPAKPVRPAAPLQGAASPPSSAVVMGVGGNPPSTGEAPTIEYLKRLSEGAPKFDLPVDIELRNGMIFYTTGEPFDGILSIGQLRILETSKKLLARKQASTRTTGAFVAMPTKL